jgi:hypothetical protein
MNEFTFIFEHPGVCLGGFSAVTAADEDHARSILFTLLQVERCCDPDEAWTAKLIWRSDECNSQVIWNGDY